MVLLLLISCTEMHYSNFCPTLNNGSIHQHRAPHELACSVQMYHSWWPAASSWLLRRFVRSALTWSTRTTGSCVTCWLTWRSGGRWSSSTCWPVTPGRSFLTRTSTWVFLLRRSQNAWGIPTVLDFKMIWGAHFVNSLFLLFCYCLCSKLKPFYQYFLL